MPTGSFTLSPYPAGLATTPPLIQVALYDPTADTSAEAYSPIPNVICLRIDKREGPTPAVANFAYILDDNLGASMGWPSQVESIWPIDAQPSPYVIENDDRIVVGSTDANGNLTVLFDGFAQIPQADITPRSQSASFSAVSVCAREWDAPIRGRLQRGADSPYSDPSSGPTDTDLPCRFNPSDTTASDGGKGGITANCTPDGYDVDESDDTTSYPVFLDPSVDVQLGNTKVETYWSISKACRYLMSVGNPNQDYVQNPDFSVLTDLLQSYAPSEGSTTISLSGDTTADITIRDYDASDKAWPDAVAELLSYAGFACSFVTSIGDDGFPLTELDIYRRDALTTIAPKAVSLQQAGTSITSGGSNVGALHLARDCNFIVNQYSIESPLKQVEASFILAPLYTPQQSDKAAGPSGVGQFNQSSWTAATTATTRRKYRWYGVDETGLGHFNIETSTWATTAMDFSPVFFPSSNGTPQYVARCRPGSTTLISTDQLGRPLKADLSISFDYIAPGPGVWDGVSGHWFKINGGWQLLDDRLGVKVSIESPEQWNSGKTLGDIRGVSWWADPTTIPSKDPGGNPTNGYPPVLRLTTVIDDDRMMSVIASKRDASPTQFTRRRRADCRDHFQHNRVLSLSLYNSSDADVIARDDTALAQSHAYQLRMRSEFPPVAGQVDIPGLITDYYELGDRISSVNGRNINLQTNVGSSSGEAPDYPFVVGLTWQLQPELATVLILDDHRAEATNL